jgi:hypothetical protein
MAVGTIISQNNRGRRVEIDWETDQAGEITKVLDPLAGILRGVAFRPGAAGGQNAPENTYDVTILDQEGVDLLAGQGANLSNTTATRVAPGVPFKDGTTTSIAHPVVDGALTLVLTNGTNNGTKRQGRIVLYLE